MDHQGTEAGRGSERVAARGSLSISTGTLLDALSVLVIVLDPEGRIVFLNQSCEELCRCASAELTGTHLSELTQFPPFDGRTEHTFEAMWSAGEGGDRRVKWSCRPVFGAQATLRLIVCSGVDVTEQHEAAAAHQRQIRFLHTLLDRIPNPVFFKSVDGRYLGCNEAFSGLLGIPREQIVGRTVYDITPPALAALFERRDRALFDAPGVQVYEASVHRADGEVQHVVFYKATYPDPSGNLAGLIGIIVDVTERRRAEMALEEARNALESRVKERTAQLERSKDVAVAADRAKTEFMNIASHELRTPLTSLLMAVQRSRLSIRSGRPVQDAALNALERHIHRLMRLARDLLDVSRLERGELAVHRTGIDLRQPVADAVDDFRKLAHDRTFSLDAPERPISIEADADRIEQVLSNVLDNAVKHTPAGSSVEVALHCDGATATITVADHGPGIPPEHQPLIFTRYFRRDSQTYQAGLGLGLYIARELVLRHGGTMAVESSSKGSTFTVRLPARWGAAVHSTSG